MLSKKVLFVSQSAYVGGGMEHWLSVLSEGIASAGGEVVVALLEGARFHRPEKFLERHKLKVACRTVKCHVNLREERVRAVIGLLRDHDDFAVVPVGSADVADAVGVAKNRGMRLRLITCLHGLSARDLGELKRVDVSTDAAVSVSAAGRDWLRENTSIPFDRVHHIPFGVDPATWSERAKPSGYGLRAAYVGRLDHREKRVFDLIAIADQLEQHDVTLEIVGDGPDRLELERRLCRQAASGRVVFRGYVDNPDLARQVYPSVDALLILSAAEGGPITAWEAMAHGVVPVTSDFLGRKQEPAWRPGENCLVFPVGDTSRAARLLMSLRDDSLRLRLSNAARDLPVQYSRKAFVAAWMDVLNQVWMQEARCEATFTEVPRSHGRLRHFPALRASVHRIRALVGWRTPGDAGSEWPSTYGAVDDA